MRPSAVLRMRAFNAIQATPRDTCHHSQAMRHRCCPCIGALKGVRTVDPCCRSALQIRTTDPYCRIFSLGGSSTSSGPTYSDADVDQQGTDVDRRYSLPHDTLRTAETVTGVERIASMQQSTVSIRLERTHAIL